MSDTTFDSAKAAFKDWQLQEKDNHIRRMEIAIKEKDQQLRQQSTIILNLRRLVDEKDEKLRHKISNNHEENYISFK